MRSIPARRNVVGIHVRFIGNIERQRPHQFHATHCLRHRPEPRKHRQEAFTRLLLAEHPLLTQLARIGPSEVACIV